MSEFTNLDIDPNAIRALANFSLPDQLEFGKVISPIMVMSSYKNGAWGQLELLPYGPLMIDPCMKVLHYGQEIFEGLKAYNVDNAGPNLFRPQINAKRFNLSAKTMAMAEIDESLFIEAVKVITAYNSKFIPTKSGTSLYIRPFMFASEVGLGIKPSNEFVFLVVASPSGPYFSASTIDVMIERNKVRAALGGTGHAKTGGNYARGLLSAVEGQKNGFHQTLWLDAASRTKIEELSGMNFFAVINGELHTPKLGPTILNGITRDSIITLSSQMGLKVIEKDILIDELIVQIKSGQCSEAFACGTASIVSPINSIGEASGEKYQLKGSEKNITMKVRQYLLDIQEKKIKAPKGWIVDVPPVISNAAKTA